MISKELFLFGLMCFTLLTAPASAQVAPNGSAGTIDFRYPDVIVSPLVPCPYVGVFPHPRDCRWFYRCYDTYESGHFWRAYFECGPGTMFSDTLDQCVFPGPANNCLVEAPQPSHNCRTQLSGCRQQNVCAPSAVGSSFVYTTEICSRGLQICLGAPNVELCSAGYVYDVANNECIQEQDLCQTTTSTHRPVSDFGVKCEDQVRDCRDYRACLPGRPAQVYRLCYVTRYCYDLSGLTSRTNKCPENQLFNVYDGNCMAPVTPENQCPGSDLIVHDNVQCTQESEHCSVYTACETLASFLGCTSDFMCGQGTPRRRVCERDAVFVPSLSRCVAVPTQRQLGSLDLDGQPAGGFYSPCIHINFPNGSFPDLVTPGPEPTDSSTIAPTPDTITETIPVTPTTPAEVPPTLPPSADVHDYIAQFQCPHAGLVPNATGHIDLQCSDEITCIQHNHGIETTQRCRKYFICDYSPFSSDLQLFLRECSESTFFSFQLQTCLSSYYFPATPCRNFGETTTPRISTDPTLTIAQSTPASETTVTSTSEPLTTEPQAAEPPTTVPPTTPANYSNTSTISTTPSTPSTTIVVFRLHQPCFRNQQIPKLTPEGTRVHCKNIPLCIEGIFQGVETRCTQYYTCRLNPATNTLYSEATQCPAERYFDPKTETCKLPTGQVCGETFARWISHRNSHEFLRNDHATIERLYHEILQDNTASSGPQLASSGPQLATLGPQLAPSGPQLASSGPQLASLYQQGQLVRQPPYIGSQGTRTSTNPNLLHATNPYLKHQTNTMPQNSMNSYFQPLVISDFKPHTAQGSQPQLNQGSFIQLSPDFQQQVSNSLLPGTNQYHQQGLNPYKLKNINPLAPQPLNSFIGQHEVRYYPQQATTYEQKQTDSTFQPTVYQNSPQLVNNNNNRQVIPNLQQQVEPNIQYQITTNYQQQVNPNYKEQMNPNTQFHVNPKLNRHQNPEQQLKPHTQTQFQGQWTKPDILSTLKSTANVPLEIGLQPQFYDSNSVEPSRPVLQLPGFEETLIQQVQEAGYGSPEFRQARSNSPTLFDAQVLGDRGHVQEDILADRGFVNPQPLGSRGAVTRLVNETEIDLENREARSRRNDNFLLKDAGHQTITYSDAPESNSQNLFGSIINSVNLDVPQKQNSDVTLSHHSNPGITDHYTTAFADASQLNAVPGQDNQVQQS
ncbi:uncharacterized protein LOC108671948 isoform X2 [Hyalella azteca]|uniref:Uncharacterized protein LOC108671948 isoform X2 n=1 Tax=Hyalella azteca TaxID=294128 RepID=A0A8B7NMY1_HYAAZ|nr:uncharacterized protein LOC108671948 isoform X2 [Hyalella azteca]